MSKKALNSWAYRTLENPCPKCGMDEVTSLQHTAPSGAAFGRLGHDVFGAVKSRRKRSDPWTETTSSQLGIKVMVMWGGRGNLIGHFFLAFFPKDDYDLQFLKHQDKLSILLGNQMKLILMDHTSGRTFEADNGISAQESGQLKNANSQDPIEEAQGSFQYTAPDGAAIQLQYVANENGFQPQGAHLPVAPPIPVEIQRALEWNAAHPEEEDGGGRPNRP
ncbi:hypothetical protein NQ317_016676 [Molorchus minor]|uniref:Uncharacterized protein n=1 Tax=Molorchus minor TaxID=1323400 RepID=A0ABQ9J3X3_9CUCU|nr:hypothetical protein NQ317_016676 [Molorchus minor]